MPSATTRKTLGPIRGELRFDHVSSPTPSATATSTGSPLTTSISRSLPVRRSPSWVPPVPASRRSPSWSPASTTRRSGRVLIDGHDLRDVTYESLRSRLASSPGGVLFSGSVQSNIAFEPPQATVAEIERQQRAVGAHDFIAGLGTRYQTEVGERGTQLSAGQRQLVAFARAMSPTRASSCSTTATSNVDLHTRAYRARGCDGCSQAAPRS